MKQETMQLSQYCLDTQPITKFVEALPSNIRIKEIRWCGSYRSIRKKLAIPEYMKKIGVYNASEIPETINILGVTKAGVSKENIIRQILMVSRSYKVPLDKFHIQRVILTNEKGSSQVAFKRMYKEIRFPDDKRKKKLVLGMVTGTGADYHDILADVSAKKVVCTLAKTEKTIVMCSEEVVIKGK